MKNHFYLFKAGTLVGPLNEEKLEQLRANGEIRHYSWIIDDEKQTWTPLTTSPMENPFKKTRETLGTRELSGAFVFLNRPWLGSVHGIHSYGVELLIRSDATSAEGLKSNSIPPETLLNLNLADETHEYALNTKVVFQSSERHPQGMILRLGWTSGPVQL